MSLKTPIKSFIASKRFFGLIMAFFVAEALWIALSGRYPMAFDEDFHLGIIRLYAHHISPFWSGYPPGSDKFGPVAHDPSYLYQYLMSFPYRLVSAFTGDQTLQVLVLRFINIALFTSGLPLYRRLLLKTGASRAVVNFCMAIFVLIPVAPLLAAQINYDNLFLPLTALSLLLTINFTRELKSRKHINGKSLMSLLVLCLLSSLVKYAFLPIFVVIAVYVALCLWREYPGYRKLWSGLRSAVTAMSKRARWALLVLFIVSLGLFTQRYGVNLAKYHTPVPSCDQVLTVEQCQAYGPWHRDYENEQSKSSDATASPLVFAADWFYAMWFRLFFAVDGPASGFETHGPLILPGVGAIVFAASTIVATAACARRVLKRYDRSVLLLFLAVIGIYSLALWLDNYRSFVQTGQPVAINGRYLLPILPLMLVWLALGMSELLRHRRQLKLALATVAMVCMLWGGGALTYILRSNDAWYWPGATITNDANHSIQRTVGPWTPGYRHPMEFMGRHGT